MLTIDHLKKTYGSFELSIPELIIKEEDFYGIVGNNGAGKTTLLRSVLDLIKVDEGEIYINNCKVNTDNQWKKITGSYLDESFLIDHLTSFEYFKLCCELYDINLDLIRTSIQSYQEFLSSVDLHHKLIRDLSAGNKKKVGIVSSLIVKPRLLIIDEPFVNLDPTSKIQLKNILKTLNIRDKITIIISSHDLDYINEICKKVILIDNGYIKNKFNCLDHNLIDLESAFKKNANLGFSSRNT